MTQVWVVDFEFIQREGESPTPICFVAQNIETGQIVKQWIDEDENTVCPFDLVDCIYVAYAAAAEMSCHLSLGWEIPNKIIDLYAEFRVITNGLQLLTGSGLIGACQYYGINDTTSESYKTLMRDRILRGYPFTNEEQQEILDYCFKDVDMTSKLYLQMKPFFDNNRVFFRGKYSATVAQIERNGIPLDISIVNDLKTYWSDIKTLLIEKVDKDFNVFENGTFKMNKFEKYINDNNIPWETTATGRLRTDDEYFSERCKLFPQLLPLKDLRYVLGQFRLTDLAIGTDGRNRSSLRPFSSKTGRNQPSSSKYIFGNAKWVRSLIKPENGKAIAYIDYEQQEFGIASALSNDTVMQSVYMSGDPYIEFAKIASAVPQNATKQTNPKERELFKQCVLATQYCQSAHGFAHRINSSEIRAKILLRNHKEAFKKFWKWSDEVTDAARLGGWIQTPLGWKMYTVAAKDRTIRNFLMQATGANLLQCACISLNEKGIKVLATIHDAVVIESDICKINEDTETAKNIMEEVSSRILPNNFKIRTDAKIISYPDRFVENSGDKMWNLVLDTLMEVKQNASNTI